MVTLSGPDRSVLEKAVLKARDVSEDGVRKRLAAMDLTHEERPTGITIEENELRKALRVRARHLGRGRVDAHLANQEAVEQGLPFLVEELAYEAWHRMLFARFLAENDLLTHPEYGVPVSVDDLFRASAEESVDSWELAATYAANRLPGLFALKTPLRLATEDRQDLTKILGDLDASLFTASDSLGWVYQFWQAKRKKEVNAAGNKIDGNTLPAVTQLFTEDYMVDFLLQNSLGAWYVARHPETPLKENWPYLRFLDDGAPAAGTFPTWPDHIAEVTVMDPCCGSGHFLVAALHMLVDMRMEVEGVSASDATDLVLQHNLFGLELDARCTQIATFAVALEVWKRGGHPERHLPRIACSGIPIAGQANEWERLAKGDDNMRIALIQLHEHFSSAPELGSLIDPQHAATMTARRKSAQTGFMLSHEWRAVEQRLHQALAREQVTDPAAQIFVDDPVLGTLRAAKLLAGFYTLIATNVPYLSRGSHDATLRTFADETFPESKNDLATMFLQRCLAFVSSHDNANGDRVGAGTVGAVTPQNWLFLGSYQKLRQSLLRFDSLNAIARLGSGAFRTISGEVVNVALPIISAEPPFPDHAFVGLDASDALSPDAKGAALQCWDLVALDQTRQRKNPDQRLVLEDPMAGSLLQDHADAYAGMRSGDYPRFGRDHWEAKSISGGWSRLQTTCPDSMDFDGCTQLLLWENGAGQLARYQEDLATYRYASGAWKQGGHAWGKTGVIVSQMRDLPVSLYSGELFDNNTAVIIPQKPDHLPAIWAFCSSPEFNIAVRKIDSALKVTNASLVKVPFDLEYWQKVADEQYPNGLPEPYSSDPTQWIFEGTVPESDHPLQVAMARMLGYRWPEQVEDGLDALADPDGIVCLPSVYQEQPAHQRLLEVLQRAYGEAWSNNVLSELLKQAGATSLEEWLASKNGFFVQHVKLFERPFLWQITDGRKDGFSAIVNYHRLDAATLNKLIHTYLGDWIQRQQRAATQGEAGAQGRLEAATALKAKLAAIYAGEPPFDIYVRWKPLAEQSIGWNPDLNDGVRLNIRPFIEAGVLAGRVTVNWNKDRGKDPFVREEPWLAAKPDADLRKRLELHCSVDRWNDLHFSRAEKERARQLAAETEV